MLAGLKGTRPYDIRCWGELAVSKNCHRSSGIRFSGLIRHSCNKKYIHRYRSWLPMSLEEDPCRKVHNLVEALAYADSRVWLTPSSGSTEGAHRFSCHSHPMHSTADHSMNRQAVLLPCVWHSEDMPGNTVTALKISQRE